MRRCPRLAPAQTPRMRKRQLRPRLRRLQTVAAVVVSGRATKNEAGCK